MTRVGASTASGLAEQDLHTPDGSDEQHVLERDARAEPLGQVLDDQSVPAGWFGAGHRPLPLLETTVMPSISSVSGRMSRSMVVASGFSVTKLRRTTAMSTSGTM